MRQSVEFALAEAIRLENCIKEPIRTPNAVQPHGVFFSLDRRTLRVTHASANSVDFLGVDAVGMLGEPIEAVIGEKATVKLRRLRDGADDLPEHIFVRVHGEPFDVTVTPCGDLLFVEFEPAMHADESASVPALYTAMARLGKATSKEQLWAETALELKNLVGFDKVMVYHFHPDEHGEVVAEEREPEMEPYLGLHYPASDIPAQARNLYLTKLSRVIGDSAAAPSELVSATEDALDLSCAELRSVSPHHLEFMHNMGQVSTYSLSLVRGGRLIGMITSAHRTPKRLPFAVRRALEALANQVAMQLGALDEIARLERLGHFRSIRDQLIGRISSSGNLDDSLFRGEPNLLTLIEADGAALSVGGVLTTIGVVPHSDAVTAFANAVLAEANGAAVATDSLERDLPEAGLLLPAIAGTIVSPMGSSGDFIAWFRKEVTQSINWLGDQSQSNRPTTLSPRTSFSAWTQSVTGMSLPWNGVEAEASQLSREIERAMSGHATSQLAAYAMRDPLTNLPNRRHLLDRIESALEARAVDGDISLLFIDLDGFKQVNDTFGHEAGDEVLIHTATQLRTATRAHDTVARLGGDEFVVLCERTGADEVDVVAERIAEALREPFGINGSPIAVRASIGAVTASSSYSASELLRDADAAMYRAKLNGRDRSSR